MKCDLNLYEKYPVTKIVHDESDGGYMLTLADPPTKCPDGKFLAHKVRIEVKAQAPALLGYDSFAKTVTIQVPSTTFIEEQHPIPTVHKFGFWLVLVVLGLAAMFGAWMAWDSWQEKERKRARRQAEKDDDADTTARQRAYSSRHSQPAPSAPAAVAVATGSDPFMSSFAGSYLGASMAQPSRREEERPSRREPDPEPSRSYSSDSDSGSSFSSDSGGSFGSDSGGGFSSDSGGGFSSDSGGSFGSD